MVKSGYFSAYGVLVTRRLIETEPCGVMVRVASYAQSFAMLTFFQAFSIL